MRHTKTPRGEYERAAANFEASLAWFRARAKWWEVTTLILQLGGVARRQGDRQRAIRLLGEGLGRCQATGLRPLLAVCLAELAYLSLETAQTDGSMAHAERAARLLGAHAALRQALTLPIPLVDQAERVEYERAVEILRTLLGEERLDALRAEGEAMGDGPAADAALAALTEQ